MQDWESKTDVLLSMATHGRIRIGDFEDVFPHLAKQIRTDAKSSCFEFWGQSFNRDEHENCEIVDRKLLTVIGRLANHPVRDGCRYHAGLIHTYGYLLSNLKTRYGFKRDRWVDGAIEKALAIPQGTLIGKRDDSTLLQNVTFLMVNIAFGRKKRLATASRFESVSGELEGSLFKGLIVDRIEETIKLVGGDAIRLVTDIVRFRKKARIDCLVVYSYKLRNEQFLVTCFPAGIQNCDELIAIAKANESEIRPRFNLALPESVTANKGSGLRSVSRRRLGT